MRLFRTLFRDFVFGNFFIALCAVAMIFTTFLINDLPLTFTPFTIFVTAATYLLYNFHRHSFLLDYSNRISFLKSIREIRLNNFEKLLYMISTFILIVYLFYLNTSVYPYLIPLALLAISYSAPLIRRKSKKIRLLEVFFIKTPVLALVWALTTTIIPLVEQNISLWSSFVGWQIVSRTLFIFALCIPFEMRDAEKDAKNNVRTLAVVHGRNVTQIIGVVVILGELLTHHVMHRLSTSEVVALDLSSIVALLLILLQNEKRDGYYYKFIVDGTMVVRFLFLFILMRIK